MSGWIDLVDAPRLPCKPWLQHRSKPAVADVDDRQSLCHDDNPLANRQSLNQGGHRPCLHPKFQGAGRAFYCFSDGNIHRLAVNIDFRYFANNDGTGGAESFSDRQIYPDEGKRRRGRFEQDSDYERRSKPSWHELRWTCGFH